MVGNHSKWLDKSNGRKRIDVTTHDISFDISAKSFTNMHISFSGFLHKNAM